MAVIKFEGDASGAIRAINQVESALGGIQRSVQSAQRSLQGMQQALGALAAGMAGGSLLGMINDLQNMQNKLRLATNSTEEFNKANEAIKAISDKTGMSLTAVGDTYAKAAMNADKLGYSQDQVITMTNAMATALQASGASAAGSASTLYQFGQVLNKGKLNGDEFVTMTENLSGNVLNKLIANMGITREQFEQFKTKGLVAGKDFTDALVRSMGELDSMTGKTSKTLEQSMTVIQNAFATTALAILNSTGIAETFANIAQKISDNGENLIPVIKVLGVVIAGLALYFAPVIATFTAVAAAALYFADVLGPILKPVVDAVESAISGLVRTVVGLGSAMMALVQGENPFTAYSKSVEDFDNKSKKAIETQTKGAKILADANKNAQATIGAPGQMLGVSKKFNEETLRDLKAQAAVIGETNAEYQRRMEINNINKQYEYQLSASQKQQLDTVLSQIARNKELVALKGALKDSQTQLNVLNVQDLDNREIELAVQLKRNALGKDFTAEMEKTLRATIANNQAAKEALETEKQRNLLSGAATPQTKAERIATATGVIAASDPRLAMAQDYATKKKAIDDAIAQEELKRNSGLENSYAAMIAAKTNLDVEYRNAKEIADIEFENRELLRAQAHAEELMALNSRIFEAKKLQEIQAATGTQFGYETQKAMAKEAADFEKKSTLEKTQFGIDQAVNLFSSLGQQNRKAFEASKALNIAQAIMNTYMGATKALATYPWPFGLIAAAAAVAAGMVQVNAIRSQSYSGKKVGGGVSANTPYIVGENGPEMFTPASSGQITPNDKMSGGGVTNVNFTIVANDTEGFDQLLSSRKGVIQQIISDAMLDRGHRSIV